MPRPPCARRDDAIDLREHVEHARQHLRRDADAGVADATTTSPPSAPAASVDAAAVVGVLGGVVQQVGEHLRQAHGIAADHIGSAGRSIVIRWRPASITGRLVSTRLRRSPWSTAISSLQLDLAARDARDFEQVVDQPHHVVDLPLHHLADCACACGSLSPGQPQDLQRVADRRQRIAQLVRQRREELVLAAIRRAQRLASAAPARPARVADAPRISILALARAQRRRARR